MRSRHKLLILLLMAVVALFQPRLAAGSTEPVHAQHGIVANGYNGVLGSFQPSRVQSLITELRPIFTKEGKVPKVGLTPADIATNQFLDPNLHL